MTTYLISFPSATMAIADADLPAGAEAAHEVVREARAAGVHVFSVAAACRTPQELRQFHDDPGS